VQFKADDRFGSIEELWDALIPGRTARPAQVRVAPATRRIDTGQQGVATAPQVATPQVAVGRQAPAANPQPTARPQPAQPPAARPAPPRVQPQPGFLATVGAALTSLLRLTLTLALLAALGLGTFVYFARPAWAEPYVGPILDLLPGEGSPGATPTPQLTSRQVVYDLQVTVVGSPDAAGLRAAFLEAFAAQARAEFGPTTQVNLNSPPAYVGGAPALVSEGGGQSIYSARMQGYVYAP
jgi:serine/threonine-protein kinase